MYFLWYSFTACVATPSLRLTPSPHPHSVVGATGFAGASPPSFTSRVIRMRAPSMSRPFIAFFAVTASLARTKYTALRLTRLEKTHATPASTNCTR